LDSQQGQVTSIVGAGFLAMVGILRLNGFGMTPRYCGSQKVKGFNTEDTEKTGRMLDHSPRLIWHFKYLIFPAGGGTISVWLLN
jgi:hypothetical protein